MTEPTAPVTTPAGAPAARGRLAVAAATVVVLLAVFSTWLLLRAGGSEAPNGRDYGPALVIACLSFGLPASVLIARGVAGWIGPLALFIAVCLGVTAAGTAWTIVGVEDGTLPVNGALVWLTSWCWVPAYCAIPGLLVLLLPEGRLAGPRLRPLAVLTGFATTLLTAGVAVSPYALDDLPHAFAGAANPVETPGLGRVLVSVGAVLFIGSVVLGLAALAHRYRTSSGLVREQLKWVALGAAATVVLLAAAFALGRHGDVAFAAAMMPLPASVAVAVLRHRMWDVDLVINRSLVYAALTAVVVAGYVAIVAGVGRLVDESVAGILAVGVLAVALQPLHRVLQTRVNQLVYGDRDDPGAALRRLGERLEVEAEGGDVLPTVAETVARALRLPYVAVSVVGGATATHGTPDDAAQVRLELVYRGERVGDLVAAERERGRGFSAADREALGTIARQVAVAAQASRLTRDLRRSRERLVLAREEERRRLRHDLHDELGPTLAALALELESARDHATGIDETLAQAAKTARETVDEVRRLVHDLRPASLDELGLVGALRERVLRLTTPDREVILDVPGDVGALPAAVEVAAWRITSEALTNVARHASASRCVVSLVRNGTGIELRVADDGIGIDDAGSDGVGLRSMRERAEELGGRLSVESGPDGTTVTATLPVEEDP